MSHEYTTRTFTASPHEVPSSFATLDDFSAFRRVAGGSAHDRSDGIHHLSGITRNGWAIYLVQKLLQSGPDTDSLQFLTEDGYAYNFEDEHGFTRVSVIATAAIDAAVEQLDRLLTNLRANPMLVYDADDAGVFYGDDVEAALGRDYVSGNPRFDKQVLGEDGQTADYLLTYLRSMLALLKAAQVEGLSVVHALTV